MRRRTPPATPSEGRPVDVTIGIAVNVVVDIAINVAIAVDVTVAVVDVTDPHDPSCFCVAAVKKR